MDHSLIFMFILCMDYQISILIVQKESLFFIYAYKKIKRSCTRQKYSESQDKVENVHFSLFIKAFYYVRALINNITSELCQT